MRKLLLAVLWIAFLGGGTALGQTPSPPAGQAELVTALLERIDRLERRVNDLENKLACAPEPCATNAKLVTASAVDPPAPAAKNATMQEHQDHPMPAVEQSTYPSMQIRGFGDVDFFATDQKGTTSGFDLGQFVLHIASPLSKKVTYFGEVSFTAQNVAQSTVYALQVERTLIRYDYDDFFKISFGKYHTPVNYWNTEFHHGLWLQTTIARPEMVKFGGTFIPVHFVGLLGEGEIPSGGVGLNYQVGMGNGRGENIATAGDAGDINNNRAWVVNLFSRPQHIYGLQMGGSFYGDEITTPTAPRMKELISAVHFVWTRETPEFLSEFANVHHRVLDTGQVFNSLAYYIQVAYRLPWLEKKWKPYYRFEYIHAPKGEPVLHGTNLVESTAGVRYDITEFAAFKTEYRSTKRATNEPRFNGVFLQTCFTF